MTVLSLDTLTVLRDQSKTSIVFYCFIFYVLAWWRLINWCAEKTVPVRLDYIE